MRAPLDPTALDPATVAAHGVRAPAPEASPEGTGGVPSAEPIYQTSVLDFPSVEASLAPLAGEGGYVYSRHGMPNGRSLELTVAALEGGADALATSSGMSAIACALLAEARAGDRVLVQADAYGGTLALLRQDLVRFGIAVEAVDAYRPEEVARAVAADPPARALLVETLSNPLLRPVDVGALAAACRPAGTRLLVDNTFATPLLRRPLDEGAGAVLHSATKLLGGHHDLSAGVVVGDAPFVAAARGLARRLGAVVAPLDAWLACRGIRTLAVRVERTQATARELAERLRGDGRVRAVHFPGFGALVSFEVDDARRLVAALRLVTLTPSLGGATTSVSHAATSSHRALAPDERARLGISDGLLRLSVGLEAPVDLWRDLDAALAAATATGGGTGR